MNFIYEENRIYLNNEDDVVVAEIRFPEVEENTVEITRTFVDESLRGQGVAGKLMNEAVTALKEKGKKVIPTCSYARKWFENHEEYKSMVAEKQIRKVFCKNIILINIIIFYVMEQVCNEALYMTKNMKIQRKESLLKKYPKTKVKGTQTS